MMQNFEDLIKTCPKCRANFASRECPRCNGKIRRAPNSGFVPPERLPEVDKPTSPHSLTIRIPKIAPSANAFMGRIEYRKYRDIKRRWHRIVKVAVGDIRPYSLGYPCTIRVACCFAKGQKRVDCDNVFITAKLAIDGLVKAGIIDSDSPVYVRRVELCSERSAGKDGYTVITIRPVEAAKEVF